MFLYLSSQLLIIEEYSIFMVEIETSVIHIYSSYQAGSIIGY